MSEQEYTDLGFNDLEYQEYPNDFYTGYQIEQEFKREFNLKE